MPLPIFLALIGVGVLAETLFLLNTPIKESLRLLALPAIVGLILAVGFLLDLLFNQRALTEALGSFILLYYILFSFSTAILHKAKMLPAISEQTVLIYTIIFWYVFLVLFRSSLQMIPEITTVLVVISLFVLIVSFLPITLPSLVKGLMYVWFLVVIVFLTLQHFFSTFFAGGQEFFSFSPLQAIAFGMVSAYLITMLFFIYEVLPIQTKTTPQEKAFERAKKNLLMLGNSYSDYQLSIPHTLAIVIILGGFLFLNYRYSFLSFNFAVMLAILIIPQSISFSLTHALTKKR